MKCIKNGSVYLKSISGMQRHFFLVFVLGFISGLPFSLLASTLAAWFAISGVSIIDIGLLSLVQQPYFFKFLWAPLLDKALFNRLGRRTGWILSCQILLATGILVLAILNPSNNSKLIGILALVLAFTSATQDIAIDAYRAELLKPNERGLGATIAIFSYRISTMVSGALALIIADNFGWSVTFIFIAALIIPCSLIIYFIKEVPFDSINKNQKVRLFNILKTTINSKNSINIIILIFLFKLGEAFTSTSSVLLMPFLLNGLGFSLSAIGAIGKGVGILATLLGSVVAGVFLLRVSLYKSLISFATLQIFMNGLFVLLSVSAKNYTLLTLCIFCENLIAGMGMTALIAFMMAACDKKYTATQFALFSAISALPRLLAGPIGATIQLYVGWTNLFIMAVILAMPVLLSLLNLKTYILKIEKS